MKEGAEKRNKEALGGLRILMVDAPVGACEFLQPEFLQLQTLKDFPRIKVCYQTARQMLDKCLTSFKTSRWVSDIKLWICSLQMFVSCSPIALEMSLTLTLCLCQDSRGVEQKSQVPLEQHIACRMQKLSLFGSVCPWFWSQILEIPDLRPQCSTTGPCLLT